MTVHEAAKALGISPSKVYVLCARGAIPHYRHGERIVIDPADLETYRRSCRVEGPRDSEPAPLPRRLAIPDLLSDARLRRHG
jgi:excisionase family DNA binding protein